MGDKDGTTKEQPPQLVGKGFKPGQSGNPAGRPKGAKDGVRAHMQRLLAKMPSEAVLAQLESRGLVCDDKPDYAAAIAGVTVQAAAKAEPWAVKTIIEQTESPIVQKIAPTTPDGENSYQMASTEELKALALRIADSHSPDDDSDGTSDTSDA